MDIDYGTLLGMIHHPVSVLPQSPILAAQALSEDISQTIPQFVFLKSPEDDGDNSDDDDDMSISSSSSSSSLSEPSDHDSTRDASNPALIAIEERSLSPPAVSHSTPQRSLSVAPDAVHHATPKALEHHSEDEYISPDDGNVADKDTEFHYSDDEKLVKKMPRSRKAPKRLQNRPKSRKRSHSTVCERDDVGLYVGPASSVREWVETLYKVGRGAEKFHVNELRRCILCGVTSQNMRRHIQTDVKHGRLWVDKILSKDHTALCGRELVIMIHFMISAIARLNSDGNSGFTHDWTPAQMQAQERFLHSFEDVGIASALQFRLSNDFEALQEPLKRWAKFLDEERKCSSCGQPFARKDSKKRHRCTTMASSTSASISDLEHF